MPTYTINVGTIMLKPMEVCGVITTVAGHTTGLGYTITAITISTQAQTAGKIQMTISRTLTAAELAHLGLS